MLNSKIIKYFLLTIEDPLSGHKSKDKSLYMISKQGSV